MQNEPQLPAEMEKRVDEEFFTYPKRVPKEALIGENSVWHLVTKEQLKHFLATALEEQRAEMMKKVVELNKKWGAVPNDFRHWHQELVESLNGKDNHE